jgi:putative ABC transport system permease protein
MGQVLAEAGTLAIVGSALGVGVGILLSRGLIAIMEILVSQEVKQVQVPLDSLAISVAAGLGVTLAAATLPALQASRISPLQALRIRGNPREGWFIRRGWLLGLVLMGLSFLLIYRSPLPPAIQYQTIGAPVFALFVGATLLVPATIGGWERLARPWIRQIYGREGQLGSSNIQRSRSRTTLTVATLMVGVAMILGIRAMTSAFEHDIRGWIEKYLGGDLYIYSTVPLRPDLARRLGGVPGVAAVTPMRYFDVKWLKPDGDDENLAFMAIDPATYGQVTSFVFAGNPEHPESLLNMLVAGDTVFVSSVLSEKYGLQPGDYLRLKTRRGQRDFQVAAVVVDYYNQGIVIQGTWTDMRRYFGLTDVSVFLLKVQSGYAHEEVQARIDDLYGDRDHLTIVSNKTFKDSALGLLSQTLSLFDVLALIAMIVAGLGVVNTLSMNVLERTREIGMLRSLGMTRGQIGKMILAEAGMMGLIGAVFGLLFGLFMSRLFLMAIAAVQGYRLSYVMPIEGVLVSLFIALFVSQLAAVWPASRAARLRIIEAIQFE